MDTQRMLVDAADPEHPAIALAAPDRPPDLVGQGLKGDLLVGLGQRAADRSAGPILFECASERGDRLLVPPVHHVHEAIERDQPGGPDRRVFLDVVAVNRVQEQAGSNPLVQVLALLAKRFQLLAGLELLGQADAADQRPRGAVPDLGSGW